MDLDLFDPFLEQCNARLKKQQSTIYPLFKALFVETNPVPIKTAMALAGKTEGALRLPLTGMSQQNEVLLKKALKAAKIRL